MKGRRRVYLQGEGERCRRRWHGTASVNLIRRRFHRASPSRIAAPGPRSAQGVWHGFELGEAG